MINIESKPYKLRGKIQHYDWGTKNKNAFIPKFLGIDHEKDVPYAEYWIGVHPKAPSEILINSQWISLIDILDKYPNEVLGRRISEKFKKRIPFLLKILSINQALSIQAHPDKKLAGVLNKRSPENYPDNNHKPEIAIAIDKLTAIVGLKKLDEIIDCLDDYPEIKSLIPEDYSKIQRNNNDSEIIKEIYSQIMRASNESLKECINNLVERFKQKKLLNESEKQFLIQFENYGIDIGLISILLFNLVNLNSGDAIFTPAGIPHAYIGGNIIECMANSDNVVRAGLTPKFKDIDTLLEMIETDSSKADVNKIVSMDSIIYKTKADEFEVEQILFSGSPKEINSNEIYLLLILDGELNINYAENRTGLFKRGDVVLIPAILNQIKVVGNNNSKIFKIKVP